MSRGTERTATSAWLTSMSAGVDGKATAADPGAGIDRGDKSCIQGTAGKRDTAIALLIVDDLVSVVLDDLAGLDHRLTPGNSNPSHCSAEPRSHRRPK